MAIEMNLNWHKDLRDITTLKDMLESSAELFADRPAFLVKKIKGDPYAIVKYDQLKADVDALGTALLALGLKGKKIALMGENCYEWIVSYYAIVNGTGIVVPFDKELSKKEIDNLLDASKCEAVFYSKAYEMYFQDRSDLKIKIGMDFYGDRTSLEEELPNELSDGLHIWKNFVGYGEKLLKGGDRSFVDSTVDPFETHMLLYTSGTTGNPKGVMLNHSNITSNIMDTCRIARVLPEDRTLSILPIHHTYESTLGIMLINYRGASVAFCEGLKYITKNMEEAGITLFVAVPLILESIYDKIWKQAEKTGKAKTLRKAISVNNKLKLVGMDLSKKLFAQIHENFGGKLRMIITGAAAMTPKVFRGFEDLGITVLQGYGLTECSPLVSGTPDFDNLRYKKAGSVGPVVMHGEIQIINKDEDGIGEIIYKGPNVMSGYYNMPEATEEVLKDGWYYTGDLGFLDKDGWLYITGRKKNVIVTRTGKNIYPEEIEGYINESKYIAESMVFASNKNNVETVGVQVLPDFETIEEEFGFQMSEDEIYKLIKNEISKFNEGLAIYKRIRDIIIRKEDFIRTTTKKIKRQENIQTQNQ